MSLGTIRTRAQYRVDQTVTQASGKWSLVWWLDLINQVKDVLAQETGFYQKRFHIAMTASTQVSTMPAICHGIRSLFIGNQRISVATESQMDDDYPGWRYQSNFPNQPQGDNIEVVSSSALDTTQTITIYGTNSVTGAYATEALVLTGTDAVAASSLTTWGEIHYATSTVATVATVCVGTVTIRIHAAGATITTIPIGSTSVGTAITTGTPLFAVPSTTEVWWYPIPDANYTALCRAAGIPPDLATTDGALITGLPVQFEWLVADGAAALASIGDLYTSSQQARENVCLQSFWAGVEKLRQYVVAMSLDSQGQMTPDPTDSYQDFYRRS